MPNLNDHDVLFLGSNEFESFQAHLERAYGFSLPSYEFPPYVSFTSRKAIIHTDKGTFFLKEKPVYASAYEARTLAAEFQSFLSTRMRSVPALLQTIDGQHYIEWNDRYLFLAEYKPGRLFNGTDSDIKLILDELKQLQHESSKFTSPSQDHESYEFLLPISVIESLAVTAAEVEIIERIRVLDLEIRTRYNNAEKSSYQMAHGDFSLFNVLLNETSVISLNDFDNAKRLPCIQDLVEFLVSATLINYLAPLSNLKLPLLLRPDAARVDFILQFYVKDIGLNSSEIELLPILAEMVWFDILLLSILKEDMTLVDILPALDCLEKGELRMHLSESLARIESFSL